MTDVNGENLERIGRAMQLAWVRVKKAETRMWGEWMTIGEGLLEGRRWAMKRAGTNRPEGKAYITAFAEWLTRYKVDDMDKSDRAKLLQLMEERPAVEEWRSTLSDYERRSLNNPVIVWRKWTAATRVKKPRPRTAGFSAREMGRAQQMLEQRDARITELEEEVAAGRASPPDDDAPLHERLRKLLSTAYDLYSGADWPKLDKYRQARRARAQRELSELTAKLCELARLVEPVTGDDVDAEASAEARKEEAALQEMHPVEE